MIDTYKRSSRASGYVYISIIPKDSALALYYITVWVHKTFVKRKNVTQTIVGIGLLNGYSILHTCRLSDSAGYQRLHGTPLSSLLCHLVRKSQIGTPFVVDYANLFLHGDHFGNPPPFLNPGWTLAAQSAYIFLKVFVTDFSRTLKG